MAARRALLALCVLALGVQGVKMAQGRIRPIDDPVARYLQRFDGAWHELVTAQIRRIGYVGDAVNVPGVVNDEPTGLLLAQHALLPIVLTRDLSKVRFALVNWHAHPDAPPPKGFAIERELAPGVAIVRRR